VPVYEAIDNGPAVALSNADGQSPYSGVGRLRGRVQCTAALIRTKADRPSRAYVLTNGHCATTFGSNEVAIDQPAPSNYRVTFGMFQDAPNAQREVAVRRIAFSTMKGTDLAILELDASPEELERAGVRGRALASAVTPADEPLVIVGAPLQGVAGSALQLSACRLEASVGVVLEYQWHWFGLERNSCAGIAPGSSGSPMISRRTGEIVAVVNTTTSGSLNDPAGDCWLDRPCEVTGSSAASRPGANYGPSTLGLSACFDDRGDFEVTRGGCPLDDGAQLSAIPGWIGYANPSLASTPIGQPRRRWDVGLSGPFARYGMLVVPSGDLDACRDPGNYTPGRPLPANTRVDEPLPVAEGRYALCLLGEDGPGGSQRFTHPNVVTVAIDATPPKGPAPFTVDENVESWIVHWNSIPPEQTGVLFKSGLAAETNCSDPSGYRLALVPFVSLPFAPAEQRLCAIGFDSAGNQAPPVERLLPPR